MAQRVVKLNQSNKSILIRALHRDFTDRKAKGQDFTEVGNFILRVDGVKGRLCVSDTEYRMAMNALNELRNQRLATGGYTDALDDALIQFSKAHRPLFGCCRS